MVQIMNEKSFFVCSRDRIWEACSIPGNGGGISSLHTFLRVALPFLEQVCNKQFHRKLSEISLTFLLWNGTFIGKKRRNVMGTVINAAAVIIGGTIGMLVKGGLPLRVRDLLMRSLGLCTLFIGISGAISAMMQVDGTRLQANGTLLLICSLGIGAVAGELLRLEDRMEGLAHRLQSMVKSISKKLGVHKEIQVVILEKAGGPMLYGGLKPRIILPRIYEPQQLNMIFTHELIHYKHHDLIWKHLANIICCIYWFQPALKDVFYQLDQWGETYCDRTVCEYLSDVKGYFSTIIDISMEEIRYGRYTTAGLYESKEVLKLRMERMKSYRQQRRLRRGISVSVLFGMIILSAATVFASGIGFVKAYDKIADETREEINVGTEGDIKDQKAKYRMYDKTRIKKCMIKNERLKENDGKPFTWKIKPKERIETKEGHLKKGTCVQVAACMGFEEEHPETHIAIGIIDEDGEETYIENGVNLVSHLKVKKDGRYRVFLENLGAKKAIAGGHYMVITEEE